MEDVFDKAVDQREGRPGGLEYECDRNGMD
jgi:hypothetical protein